MTYEMWDDCMDLFQLHLIATGWVIVSEKISGHRVVVKQVRKDYGWMTAIRYCKMIREGIMRETVDMSVGNYEILQQHILDKVLLTAGNFGERGVKNNPYAPGGEKASICPRTGEPKKPAPKASTSSAADETSNNRHANGSSYRGGGGGRRRLPRGSYNDRDRRDDQRDNHRDDRRDDRRQDSARGPRWGDSRQDERDTWRRERSRSPDRRNGGRGRGGNAARGRR